MKKFFCFLLVFTLVIISPVAAYSYDENNFRTSCETTKTDIFFEKFYSSNNMTIHITPSNIKDINGNLVKHPITLKYKDNKSFYSLNLRGRYYNYIHCDGKETVYYPALPFFYITTDEVVPVDTFLIGLMIFHCGYTVRTDDYLCYNETIDGITYHIEESTDSLNNKSKFYYLEGDLVRFDYVNAENPSVVERMDLKITFDDVDDSCFELPTSAFLDLSWLYAILLNLFGIFL